jgi:hypothetical protein
MGLLPNRASQVCAWLQFGIAVNFSMGSPMLSSTITKSAEFNASIPWARPVIEARIMQRANAHAGAYLHDSSSIKALPPQTK